MPVHATPSMTSASHALGLGMASGSAHNTGKVSASVAPSWLPAAETKGGKLGKYFLVKLPEMA